VKLFYLIDISKTFTLEPIRFKQLPELHKLNMKLCSKQNYKFEFLLQVMLKRSAIKISEKQNMTGCLEQVAANHFLIFQ
jgi:hypothetical protein